MRKTKLFLTNIFVLFLMILCSCGNETTKNESSTYISLDINPAIELIVDEDNKVVSIRGENEDGQVLLYDEKEMKGLDLQQALEKIIQLSVELGYLDKDNQVVHTLVSSSDEEYGNQILENLNSTITATASNLGLTVTTDVDGAYSLLRKLELFQYEFPNNQAIQKLSVSKFKLALSVSEMKGISLEAAVEMDDEGLILMLNDVNQTIENFATQSYLEAKNQAMILYDQVTEIASYSAYTKFYIDHILKHPFTAYYGGLYQIYATTAKGVESIYQLAKGLNHVLDYPLDEQQIKQVMNVLGMQETDIELIKNSNGEITINSIDAYANKYFKNSKPSAELEKVKKELTTLLNEVQANIDEITSELTEEYKEQLAEVIDNSEQLITTVEQTLKMLPEELKKLMNENINEIKELLSEIQVLLSQDKIVLEDVYELSKKLDNKAQELFNKIKNDLSEDELAMIEQERSNIKEKMTAQKQEFEKKLADAEQEAKQKLSDMKAKRKAQ